MNTRTVLWWMVFTGFAINYMVRININIAIVSMVRGRVSATGDVIVAECSRNDTHLLTTAEFRDVTPASSMNESTTTTLPAVSV
jgi:hypothetical protein